MKQKLDVGLIEFGLKKQIFISQTVLDLLYLPLIYEFEVCPTGTWLINGFTEIPQSVRERLVRLSLQYDKEETTLILNRRVACILYTMLDETRHDEYGDFYEHIQDLDMVNEPHSPNYKARFDYGSPLDAVKEIFLWHKWGLEMSNAKLNALKNIWENLLRQEDGPKEPEKQKSWIVAEKAKFRQTLKTNRKKIKSAMNEITQLENLINKFLVKNYVDINDRIAVLKAADKYPQLQQLRTTQGNMMSDLDTLLDESTLIEIKLAACEIPAFFTADFTIETPPPATFNQTKP